MECAGTGDFLGRVGGRGCRRDCLRPGQQEQRAQYVLQHGYDPHGHVLNVFHLIRLKLQRSFTRREELMEILYFHSPVRHALATRIFVAITVIVCVYL